MAGGTPTRRHLSRRHPAVLFPLCCDKFQEVSWMISLFLWVYVKGIKQKQETEDWGNHLLRVQAASGFLKGCRNVGRCLVRTGNAYSVGGMQTAKSCGLSFGNEPVSRSRGHQGLCKCGPILSYSENKGDPFLDTSLCITSPSFARRNDFLRIPMALHGE